jgi:1,4-dihydroxy-2-naphthoate octaprenyltransferase
MKKFIIWIKETRPQFLTLAVVLAFFGTALAWYYGPVNIGYALLGGLGLMLTHGSANAVNDYFDYKSGIDLEVEKTPFSGGSGLIKNNQISLNQALWVGIITTLAGAAIGVFFCIVKGIMLLPLLITAVICLVLYTPVILKTPWPEWSPGLGLGILPVLAFYFIQFGHYDWVVLIASVPSGIMVHNLLLLNEFPDVEADRNGGRKTTPVVLGLDLSAKIFAASTIGVYVWIGGCAAATIILGKVIMPVHCLIAFFSLPFALKAIKGAKLHKNRQTLIKALGDNVSFILFTHIFLGIGYILARLFPF